VPLASPELLARICSRLLSSAGTPEPIVSRVTEILIGSNLAGHDSHGVLRIPTYLRQIEQGILRPAERPAVLRELAATVLADGRDAWGHYTADWAMDLAIRKAAVAGTCTIVLRRCHHIGRLGEYAEKAARAGFVGTVTVGYGGKGVGCAAPLGGTESALGTNPYAFGVPTGDDHPFVVDFATTIVAEGKVQVMRSKGQRLPEGWVVDRDGRPSTDPADFYDGGNLLFAGGHKGYALSLFAVLTAGLGGFFQAESWKMQGVTIQAINPEAFLERSEYEGRVRAFLTALKGTRKAEGAADILYPGEPEQRALAERSVRGIEVPETIWSQLREGAEKLGLAWEEVAV
jgi:LDH2 family malate/lactate/ureidoglycolate dehydrogenase